MKIEDNLKEIFTDKNNIKWDAYFMSLAKLSAFRSKDPNTKVGACIVNKNKYVVSLGYNGMPTGVNETKKNNDEYFSWDRPKDKDDVLNSKYTFVIHAEQNAIINANITNSNIEEGSTIYVTHFPCYNCAKLLVQSKIAKVIYETDYVPDSQDHEASEKILKTFKVDIVKLEPKFDIEFKIKK